MIGINPRWLHRQPHVPDVAPCVQCGLAEQHRAHCPRNGARTVELPEYVERFPQLTGMDFCKAYVGERTLFGYMPWNATADDEVELYDESTGEMVPVVVRYGDIEATAYIC